jgi:hypothetical protein
VKKINICLAKGNSKGKNTTIWSSHRERKALIQI